MKIVGRVRDALLGSKKTAVPSEKSPRNLELEEFRANQDRVRTTVRCLRRPLSCWPPKDPELFTSAVRDLLGLRSADLSIEIHDGEAGRFPCVDLYAGTAAGRRMLGDSHSMRVPVLPYKKPPSADGPSMPSSFDAAHPNRSHHHDRTLSCDREKGFADRWEEENEGKPYRNYGQGLLDALLPDYMSATVRDKFVAATVVQWLGSNCGMSFLHEALKPSGNEIHRERHPVSPGAQLGVTRAIQELERLHQPSVHTLAALAELREVKEHLYVSSTFGGCTARLRKMIARRRTPLNVKTAYDRGFFQGLILAQHTVEGRDGEPERVYDK